MTPQQLQAAMGCTAANAERFAGPLSAACAFYSIDTPTRLAAFLAQIGHESGALRYTSELWGPTPAQKRYEGRADLGNTQPGDGERFKGHGLIQTTGRFNHARVRDRLRERFSGVPDFETDPEALTDPQWASLSATDYWDDRGLNALADAGNFEAITRRINGGLNGQADRLARWERAKRALSQPADVPQPVHLLSQEQPMPIAPIIGALLPSVIEAIPKLGKLFGSGSEVAERNVKAAELAVGIVQEAVGARNAQEAAELIKTDPTAAQTAKAAIESRWLELSEAGGGGIDAARKADMATSGGDLLKSASFWIALTLLPLVYLLVLSLIGLIGTATWSDDVRAGLSGSLISAIVGGLVGYYYGQTTSRNRTAP